MKLVILESPYAGNVARNRKFAKQCIRDCLTNYESPLASHLLYTQKGILKDGIRRERKLGIDAGLAWYRVAELCVVYTDHGISPGMQQGIERAQYYNVPVQYRTLKKKK